MKGGEEKREGEGEGTRGQEERGTRRGPSFLHVEQATKWLHRPSEAR